MSLFPVLIGLHSQTNTYWGLPGQQYSSQYSLGIPSWVWHIQMSKEFLDPLIFFPTTCLSLPGRAKPVCSSFICTGFPWFLLSTTWSQLLEYHCLPWQIICLNSSSPRETSLINKIACCITTPSVIWGSFRWASSIGIRLGLDMRIQALPRPAQPDYAF